MLKIISILLLSLVGVLTIGITQEAHALTIIPNLDVNQDNGGVTLEPCSTITLSDLPLPQYAHLITWTLDAGEGGEFPNRISVTIPNDLTPGEHRVEFVIPLRVFVSSANLVTITSSDIHAFDFTIAPSADPAIQCSESPYAPDFSVVALPRGISVGLVIINFDEHVSDPMDDYDDLTITFSLQDESLYESLSIGGITGGGTPSSGDTLMVTGRGINFAPNDPSMFQNTEFLIDYTVTNSAGLFDSGVITIKFTDFFTDIEATPYAIDARSYGLSPVELLIPHEAVTSFVTPNVDSELFTAESITLTTTGISNATGTLSIVPATASRGPTLLYTPVPGYVGTETFPYTATFGASTSSSVFHIVVPAPPLEIIPHAPDFTVVALPTGISVGRVAINFDEHVSDPMDDYDDLTITFSLQDESLYESLSQFGGITGDGMPSAGDTLTATGVSPVAFAPNDPPSFLNTEFLIDYTVTNSAGLSSNGVITIKFVAVPSGIEATPYTIDARLFDLPTVELLIPHNAVTEFTTVEINSQLFTAELITLTTTGIGDKSGTLSIVRDDAGGAIFTYTPAPGFVGTETFPYTASFRDSTLFGASTSSSVFHIVVPGLVLTITPNLNVNQAAGGITLEPCSTIDLSDLRTRTLAHLTKWTIDGNSFPDGSSVIIPDNLSPGIHIVEFEIPHTLRFSPDVSFATSTRDDFKFTIAPSADPAIQCSESPIASDFTTETLVRSNISLFVTIFFAEHVSDPMDDYDDLTVTFRLQDESLYESFSQFIGIDGDDFPSSGDILTVTNSAVFFLSLDAQMLANTEFFIDYTVTNSGGFSDSGVITVRFADYFTDIESIPYTIDAKLYGHPTLELQIPHNAVRLFVVPELDSELFTAESITLTTTGIGNVTGTLSIVPATASRGPTLLYTPVPGYVGTETFDYTATFRGSTSSSEFHIVVPALALGITPNLDVNQTAGGIILEPCNVITITDQSTPSLAHLTKWTIDGVSFQDGSRIITIPNDLTPGQHNVEFEIPRSTATLPDGSFVSSTSDDFIFTIAPPVNPVPQCSASPTAPDFTAVALPTGLSIGLVTIIFAEHVTDPMDDYDDLTITFSSQDMSLYESLSIRGITGGGTPSAGDTLTTTGRVMLTPRVDISALLNTEFLIDYTVTNSAGLSDSGVVTVKFVDFPSAIEATPYTITLDELFGLPILVIQIPHEAVTSFVAPNVDSELFTTESITLTTTGIGNVTGTLSIIPATTSRGPTLLYTPVPGYVGTETFPYTATFGDGTGFRDKTSSSEFHIVVPALLCDTNLDAGVSFGNLDGGEVSDTQRVAIINTGNADAQVMMKGDDWISVVDDIVVMNAEVTKYSLTDAETYAEKTSFTATAENIGNKLGEGSLSVYLQLFIELIDDSFRGDAAQELTVSSDCS